MVSFQPWNSDLKMCKLPIVMISTINIQDLHMRCQQFYSSSAHQLKDTHSVTFTMMKMVSQVDKAEMCFGFMRWSLWLLGEDDFKWHLERNHHQKIQFIRGINCLRRLLAFVKENSPVNKCLKIR